MGIDAADYDNDGDIDLWVSNFSLEANYLPHAETMATAIFEDVTFDTDLLRPIFLFTRFRDPF